MTPILSRFCSLYSAVLYPHVHVVPCSCVAAAVAASAYLPQQGARASGSSRSQAVQVSSVLQLVKRSKSLVSWPSDLSRCQAIQAVVKRIAFS